jgi:hypothetical protein
MIIMGLPRYHILGSSSLYDHDVQVNTNCARMKVFGKVILLLGGIDSCTFCILPQLVVDGFWVQGA